MLSSGLICDKCVQLVADEDGFAGVCQGELCRENDIHMCRNCAHVIDETLTNLYCKECLDHQYEGEEYSAPTYAEVIEEAKSSCPRAEASAQNDEIPSAQDAEIASAQDDEIALAQDAEIASTENA